MVNKKKSQRVCISIDNKTKESEPTGILHNTEAPLSISKLSWKKNARFLFKNIANFLCERNTLSSKQLDHCLCMEYTQRKLR